MVIDKSSAKYKKLNFVFEEFDGRQFFFAQISLILVLCLYL